MYSEDLFYLYTEGNGTCECKKITMGCFLLGSVSLVDAFTILLKFTEVKFFICTLLLSICLPVFTPPVCWSSGIIADFCCVCVCVCRCVCVRVCVL